MTFEEKFGFAITLAAAELAKYTAKHGPKEIGSLVEECFEGVEEAERRCRGLPE